MLGIEFGGEISEGNEDMKTGSHWLISIFDILICVERGHLPDVLRWREKGTDLRRKARGSGGSKPAESRVEIHIWSNECKRKIQKKYSKKIFTHVTAWRVWSHSRKCFVVLWGSNSMFVAKIQGRLVSTRSSTRWDRGRSCDSKLCSELNIFYQHAIEIHRMYIVYHSIICKGNKNITLWSHCNWMQICFEWSPKLCRGGDLRREPKLNEGVPTGGGIPT